jgi:hypothetical protein
MSDLGLGNLATLKGYLQSQSLAARSDFDMQLSLSGRSVASAFDRFCNRRFKRTVNESETFTSDRDHWILNRYPVESISLVEQKFTDSEGFLAIETNDLIRHLDNEAGTIWFGAEWGWRDNIIRVTYTGGYWFSTNENTLPTDSNYGADKPSGAAILPDDILTAWLIQCQHEWDLRDKLGLSTSNKPGEYNKLDGLDFVPRVESTLKSRQRLCLT